MTKFDYNVGRGFNFLWLVVAILAVLASFIAGAWHQLFIAALSTIMFLVTRQRPFRHVPEDTYEDLNTLISQASEQMDDDDVATKVIESDFDEGYVSMKVELRTSTSSSKFMDYAWGNPKQFTETTWSCEVKILEVTVTDHDNNAICSDFDEDYIETEYEVTEWK